MKTEKAKRGPKPGPATDKFTVMLEPDTAEWGKQQPGGLSELVRGFLRQAWYRAIVAKSTLPQEDYATSSISSSPTSEMERIYERLTEQQQILFRHLAIFPKTWTLDAAQAISSLSQNSSVLDLLLQLIAKSLVFVVDTSEEPVRFGMYDPVRDYGLSKLHTAQEINEIKSRHACYFMHLVEEAEPHLLDSEQERRFKRLDWEIDNIRMALEWSKETEGQAKVGLRLASALLRFWRVRGYLGEGQHHLEELLSRHDAVGAMEERAKALIVAGTLASNQGKNEEAASHGTEALRISRRVKSEDDIAASQNLLGKVAIWQEKYPKARQRLERALRIWRQRGHKRGMADALHNLGLACANEGKEDRDLLNQALGHYEESLQIARELGDREGQAITLTNIANCYSMGLKEPEKALTYILDGLRIRRELGDKRGTVYSLMSCAYLAMEIGETRRGIVLYSAAYALGGAIGLSIIRIGREEYTRQIEAAHKVLNETFEPTWAQGHAMTWEQAMEYALEDTSNEKSTGP